MASNQTERVLDSTRVQDEPLILRCRKCRRFVLDSGSLLTVSEDVTPPCTVWHVDVEALPDWILTLINQVHWTSGKLNCQHCGARLGGFSFVNCSKCSCGQDAAVHLSKSRVDQTVKHHVFLSRPGMTKGHVGVKHPALEEAEDQRRDSHAVMVTGISRSEISGETQETRVDWELRLRSPFSPVAQGSSVDEQVNEAGDPQSLPADVDHQGSSRDALVVQEHSGGGSTEEREHSATFRREHTLTKREKNRLKSLRRKQRKKERWIQRQLEDEELSSRLNMMSGDDERKEGYTCAVCLDVYFKPYMCQPCSHVFCEPCLRMLARNRTSSTPCPLCRTYISSVLFQEELHRRIGASFPKEYHSRKETFHKTNYSKWPLPSCPAHVRILWGLQRRGASSGRWQFALRALGLDSLGLDAFEIRGWTLHSDLIRVIFSFHWLLSFFLVFCGLLYVLLF